MNKEDKCFGHKFRENEISFCITAPKCDPNTKFDVMYYDCLTLSPINQIWQGNYFALIR